MSNPCFEVWLVLHHRALTGFLTTEQAERARRDADGCADKSIDPTLYMPLRAGAIEKARALAARHERDGSTFPRDNPSSSVYRLLESLGAG